jgi:hypothetical protein
VSMSDDPRLSGEQQVADLARDLEPFLIGYAVEQSPDATPEELAAKTRQLSHELADDLLECQRWISESSVKADDYFGPEHD